MPVMDGMTALPQLLAAKPGLQVIMASTLTLKGASISLKALSKGAADYVPKPTSTGEINSAEDFKRELVSKVRSWGAIARRKIGSADRAAAGAPALANSSPFKKPGTGTIALKAAPNLFRPECIAIGSSTGGPQALVELLGQMPADLGAAICIVQHVDHEFALGLVSWLRERTGFAVEVATPGRRPEAGTALVAATNDHMVMGPGGALSYTPNPRKLPFRPSVDVFFLSAVRYWRRPSIGVILTGMGRDGAAGLLAMRQARWRTIAQDEATSVVYGMPKAAAEMGAAERVLPLPRIARGILEAVAAELSV